MILLQSRSFGRDGPYPHCDMANYYQHIDEALRLRPRAVVLRWPRPDGSTRSYTGQELLDQVARLRQHFPAWQQAKAPRVLVAIQDGPSLIGGILAAMAAGATVVLPAPGLKGWRFLRLLRHRQVRYLLTDQLLPRWQHHLLGWLGIQVQPLPHGLEQRSAPHQPPVATPGDQPALISHTSGSTGQPKPIARTHHLLTAQHQAISQAFPAWPGQRDFPLFPNILLHNLAVGTLSVLPDVPGFDLRQLDPARILQQWEAEGIETLTGNVHYFQQLLAQLRAQDRFYSRVKALGVGGSPVPEMLLQGLRPYFPQAQLYVIYGSSEAEPIALRHFRAVQPPARGYLVGTFHAAIRWRIRPLGQIDVGGQKQVCGELEVQGPHVAAPSGDWLATGDFGYVDEQQQLWLTGRKGNETILGGVQHYQVEHVLLQLPGVRQAAAKVRGTAFQLYVSGASSPREIQRWIDAHFQALPLAGIHMRQQLPVDARHLSKLLYAQLS